MDQIGSRSAAGSVAPTAPMANPRLEGYQSSTASAVACGNVRFSHHGAPKERDIKAVIPRHVYIAMVE